MTSSSDACRTIRSSNRKASPESTAAGVQQQVQILRRFVDRRTVYLEETLSDRETAPSRCQMCRYVRLVYAVDVSEVITADLDPPPNFRLLLSDGCSVPVERRAWTSLTATS